MVSNILVDSIRVSIAISIFFVWIVRYTNIVEEFQEYGFPNWFRDIMGILKCIAAAFLLIGSVPLMGVATAVLSILMLSAFIVHIKHSHTFIQMLPSFSLAVANAFLFYSLVS